MDDELLRSVYHFLFPSGRPAHTENCQYSDAVIALIELFRTGRQLSAFEAMNRGHWPIWTRRMAFPSYSQFNRRVKTEGVQRLIAELSEHFRLQLPQTDEKVVDGKPLLVGGFSKDPDARRGRVPGGWGRGYKLHAVVDSCGAVETWKVTPLNEGESTVAQSMLPCTELSGARVRADANYDSVVLYRLIADAGGRFIAPRRKPGTGLGHHPQHPDRIAAITDLEITDSGQREHERHRVRVEQIFGRMTMVAFGLWGLPPSVRRLDRVRRFVNAKVALYHAYIALTASPRTIGRRRKCA